MSYPTVSLAPSLGIRQLPPPPGVPKSLDSLYDLVQVWEVPRRNPPHRGFRYVVAADVSDGLGQCRSVVDVVRVGTVLEPQEQVAQYVSTSCTPVTLAYIIDALGRAYTDPDGFPAKVAVEVNNHGHSTQAMLQAHLDYPHFYRRELEDRANRAKRFATTIGWNTTPLTRPRMLDRFVEAVSTRDPTTKRPDFVLNSPITLDEMRGFYSDTGGLADASASKHGYDDCIITAAIANVVAWLWLGGEVAPIAEQRRQKSGADSRRRSHGLDDYDWRNSDATLAEMRAGVREEAEAGYDVDDTLLF